MELIMSLLLIFTIFVSFSTEKYFIGKAKLIEIKRCYNQKCVVKYEFNNTTFFIIQLNPKIGDFCNYTITKPKYINLLRNQLSCGSLIINNPDNVNLKYDNDDVSDIYPIYYF
jgi:hypothetical protein